MCSVLSGRTVRRVEAAGLSVGEVGQEDLRTLGGSRVVGEGLTQSTAHFRDSG